MKTAIYQAYGPPEVINIVEIAKPIPNQNEVLIKVSASAVTRADTMLRKGTPKLGRLFLGIFKPKNSSIGTGFSGVIESIGTNVKNFKVGDSVFGEVLFNGSANAEYVCINATGVLSKKPHNISHKEAAIICDGFLTSYSFLKDIGNVKPGNHVLINGGSGSLGSAGVQLSKLLGAKVTAVCSASNADLVKSLGADVVLDYNNKDFTQDLNSYDFIYDAVGKSSFSRSKRALTKKGIYMSPVLSGSLLFYSIFSSKHAKFSATGLLESKALNKLVKELYTYFEQGEIHALIDRTYTLNTLVEAHHYIEKGHKRGNIAIVN